MKSIVLLSGGIDSLVSIAQAKNETEVVLALFFDYGQKALARERQAAEAIAGHYAVPFKPIKLDWLQSITKTALVNKNVQLPVITEVTLGRQLEIKQESAKAVWVPNRNAVFISIAASFAEAAAADLIITGFNSEEAATFPDNSLQFVNIENQLLRLSTLNKPKVTSYVQSYNKGGIINMGVKLGVPFDLVWSCYGSGRAGKMCSECESCARSIRALKQTGNWELMKDKFFIEEKI
ncbi:MAG: 7-cyano-7-deazaguanine synthase QueC [Candidatus Saganbacteria bacterium]|nr:7-cyano-7-deazaguanine synthase QueC [Candidatus Saganbacteria bacterium]